MLALSCPAGGLPRDPRSSQQSNSKGWSATSPVSTSSPLSAAPQPSHPPQVHCPRLLGQSSSLAATAVAAETVRKLSVMQTDRSLKIKLGIAKGTGRLDFGWCDLEEVPEEVFELEDLEVRGALDLCQPSCSHD